MFVNTYGRGGEPPPPIPPVAHDFDSHAVMVPSLLAPSLISAKADGRLPAICSSVARSRNVLTGLPPANLERCAPSTPQRSDANLLPNPPPIYCISVWTLVAGIARAFARSPVMLVTA